MHPLLADWLTKLNIKSVTDLREEEKEKFDDWSRTLSDGEITVEKIILFCKSQKKIIESQYANPDNTDKKDAVLKASLGIYNSLLRALEGTKVEREAVERELTQLINSPKIIK